MAGGGGWPLSCRNPRITFTTRQRRVYVADRVAEKRLRRLRDAEKTQTFPTDRSNFPIGFLWDEEERSAKKGVTLTNGEKQENNDIQQARHVCD